MEKEAKRKSRQCKKQINTLKKTIISILGKIKEDFACMENQNTILRGSQNIRMSPWNSISKLWKYTKIESKNAE